MAGRARGNRSLFQKKGYEDLIRSRHLLAPFPGKSWGYAHRLAPNLSRVLTSPSLRDAQVVTPRVKQLQKITTPIRLGLPSVLQMPDNPTLFKEIT